MSSIKRASPDSVDTISIRDGAYAPSLASTPVRYTIYVPFGSSANCGRSSEMVNHERFARDINMHLRPDAWVVI
jgi:hypothetical protein